MEIQTEKPTQLLVFLHILYLLAALIAMFLIKATELQTRWYANSVLAKDEDRAAALREEWIWIFGDMILKMDNGITGR
jgi:hypothetical protein